MTDLVRKVTLGRVKTKRFPVFKSGDTVNVHVKVKEGEKERIQVFKGVVLKTQGQGMGRSFTVRKLSSGVGVERTFPFTSPAIDKVELVSRGKVRRSKLFFLRELRGRAARLESTLVHASEMNAPGAADEIPTPEAKEEKSEATPAEKN